MIIKFTNVGSRNAHFRVQTKELTYDILYSAVRPYLLSREIDFYYNPETQKGSVVVGIVRVVGYFSVEDDEVLVGQ